MRVKHLESLILFVSDLAAAKAFYVGALGLPVLFEDQIIAVVGGESGRVVLHRNEAAGAAVVAPPTVTVTGLDQALVWPLA